MLGLPPLTPPPPQTRDRFKSPIYKWDFFIEIICLIFFLYHLLRSLASVSRYRAFRTELVPVPGTEPTLLLTDTGLESDVTGTVLVRVSDPDSLIPDPDPPFLG